MIKTAKSDKFLKSPIRLGILFSIFTIVLYQFGVFQFYYINSFLLYLFLFLTHICMYFGFCLGLKVKVEYTPKLSKAESEKIFKKFFLMITVITLLFFIPKLLIYGRATDLNIIGVFQRAVQSFTDAHAAYSYKEEITTITGIWKIINLILVVLEFLMWAFIPLTVLFWKKVSRFVKAFFIIYAGSIILRYLSTGTNFGIFYLLLSVISPIIIKNIMFKSQKNKCRKKGKNIKNCLILILAIMIFLNIFNMIMKSRIGTGYSNFFSSYAIPITINTNSIFWKLTPDIFRPLICSLTAYIGQGYQGLAILLKLDFSSTYGFGYSRFLMDNINEIFNINLWERTYLYKGYVQFLWDYNNSWQTAYAWFANDISIWGVPIVIFVLFFIWGIAWKDFVVNGNIFAFLQFILYISFIAFISANNQVFSTSNTLIGFWVYLFLWIRTHRKYDWSILYDSF